MMDKLIVGDEYDENLREKIINIIKGLGGSDEIAESYVGGSQEVNHITFNLEGRRILIESETYIGLSISADPKDLGKIVKELNRDSEN